MMKTYSLYNWFASDYCMVEYWNIEGEIFFILFCPRILFGISVIQNILFDFIWLFYLK